MKKQRRTRVVIKTGFQTKFAVVRGSPMTNWKLQLLYFSKVSDMKHCSYYGPRKPNENHHSIGSGAIANHGLGHPTDGYRG